jgi:hypothetical protein
MHGARHRALHAADPFFGYARIIVVKILLKSLIVWLMLVTVPFQGFASATMLFCAPLQAPAVVTTVAGVPAAAHVHHAVLMDQGAQHHHDAASNPHANHHGTSAEAAASQHDGSKCNSCASCCFGASMPPSQASRIPVETQHSAAIPFQSGAVPTVDLDFPERPPQAALT